MAHTPTPWKQTRRWVGVPNHQSFIAECRDQNGNWSDEPMALDNARYIVRAVNAFKPMRELLFRAIVELEYVQNVENCKSELCASQEGKEVIEEGMKLLGVKDLSENALALADKEGE